MKLAILAVLVVATACAAPNPSSAEDLPSIDAVAFDAVVADLGRPAVVNIWASWCHPCRSEAPLLSAAHDQFGDRVAFIGVDVQDNQADAKEFIAEFGLDIPHYFDRNRAIPNHYGVIGTPVTLFFDQDGVLVGTHLGVIDERALALGIDELLGG